MVRMEVHRLSMPIFVLFGFPLKVGHNEPVTFSSKINEQTAFTYPMEISVHTVLCIRTFKTAPECCIDL